MDDVTAERSERLKSVFLHLNNVNFSAKRQYDREMTGDGDAVRAEKWNNVMREVRVAMLDLLAFCNQTTSSHIDIKMMADVATFATQFKIPGASELAAMGAESTERGRQN